MANPQELVAQAQELLHKRKPEQARALFLQAAQLQGLSLDAMRDGAMQQLNDGQVVEAIQTLSQVIDANPTDIDALVGMTRGAIFLGQLDDAQTFLEAIGRMEPKHAERFLYQGLVYEAQGDLENAAESLIKAQEHGPELFLAHYNLGRVLGQAGDLDTAFNALVHATKLDPNSYDAFYMLGIVCVKAGQPDDAVRAFNRCLEIDPQQLDIYATLADVLMQVGELDTAIQTLGAGIQTLGEHPALLQKMAALCSHAGDFKSAVDFMEKVVEQIPDYLQVWINLAGYYVLIEELEKSEQAAQRAIEIDPDAWQGYFHLGNLYEATKLFEQSEQQYQKAIERAPEGEYRPMGNLACLWIGLDDAAKNQRAVEMFEQVLPQVPPGDWRFHYNLALAYAKLGRKKDVRPLLRQIRENAHPDDEILSAVTALEDNVFSLQDEVKLTHLRAPGRPWGDKKNGS